MVNLKAVASKAGNVILWPAKKVDGNVIRAAHIGGSLANDGSTLRKIVDSAVTAVPVVLAAADYFLGPNVSIVRPVANTIASVPGIHQVVDFYAKHPGVAVPFTILSAGAGAIAYDVYRRIKSHAFSKARLGLQIAAYAALTFAVWNSASTMAINRNTTRLNNIVAEQRMTDALQQGAIDSLTGAVANNYPTKAEVSGYVTQLQLEQRLSQVQQGAADQTPVPTQVQTISGAGLQKLVGQNPAYAANQLHMSSNVVVNYTDGVASPQSPELVRIDWAGGKAVAYVDSGSGAKPVELTKVTQDNFKELAERVN